MLAETFNFKSNLGCGAHIFLQKNLSMEAYSILGLLFAQIEFSELTLGLYLCAIRYSAVAP